MISNHSNINDFTYNGIIQSAPPAPPTHITNRSCKVDNLTSGYKKGLHSQFLHIKGESDDCKLEPIEQCNQTDDQLSHKKYRPTIWEFNSEYFSHLQGKRKMEQLGENKISSCPWFERGYCKFGLKCRYGHNESINPAHFNQFNFSKVCNERFSSPVSEIKICSYCKKPGHKASRCRQKKRNNMRLCRRCKCFEKIESTYKH